jgi:hypothetical protein
MQAEHCVILVSASRHGMFAVGPMLCRLLESMDMQSDWGDEVSEV